MLVTLVEVLVTDHGNVQRGTGPHPHAMVVVGVGINYLSECSNRLRCTSSRKRSRGKRSAFLSLQRVRRHSPPRPVSSDPGSDQRIQTGSDVATVDVRGDTGYSVQLPFEGRAPMAISSDSGNSDCDRTNVESFSGCRVSVSRNGTNSHRETPASRLPSTLSSRLPSSPLSREPPSPFAREPSFPLLWEPSSPPSSREASTPSLRERPTPSSRKRKRGYSSKSRQRHGPATSPSSSDTDPDLDIVDVVSSNRCRVCVWRSTTGRKTAASSKAFDLATANNGECVVRRKLDAGYDVNAVVSRCRRHYCFVREVFNHQVRLQQHVQSCKPENTYAQSQIARRA